MSKKKTFLQKKFAARPKAVQVDRKTVRIFAYSSTREQ